MFGAIVGGLAKGYPTGAEAWISDMTNDISTALKTLRLHPEDAKAQEALSGLKLPDVEEAACEELAKALLAERGFHAESNRPALAVRFVEIEAVITHHDRFWR